QVQQVLQAQRAMLQNHRGQLLAAVGEQSQAWQHNATLIAALEARSAAGTPRMSQEQQGLAMAYFARAHLALASTDPERACADLDASLERLRMAEEPTPDQRVAIAATIVTRGTLRRSRGKALAALADCEAARKELERLREQHGPLEQWSPGGALALVTA